MLIDGGNSADSSLIYAYLKQRNITFLDYIVCTHAHEDHVGGLAGALNYASVGTAFAPVAEYDTKAFQNFTKYLSNSGVSITIPNHGDTFDLGTAKCQISTGRANATICHRTSFLSFIDFAWSGKVNP